jgi:Zn finger protein HypA/HybF involved in hydrogenase expression
MGAWKDIDCARCETTSHARTRSGPELAYCPHCSSEAVDVFAGVYEGQTVDIYDCTRCSHVFNLAANPEPGYCPICGATGINRFP